MKPLEYFICIEKKELRRVLKSSTDKT